MHEHASTLDVDARALVHAVAAYIDATADGYPREAYAEIGYAYIEGSRPSADIACRRAASGALRTAGLGL